MTNTDKQTLKFMRELLLKERSQFDRSRTVVKLKHGLDAVRSADRTLQAQFGTPTENDPMSLYIIWRHVLVSGVRRDIFLRKAGASSPDIAGEVSWV